MKKCCPFRLEMRKLEEDLILKYLEEAHGIMSDAARAAGMSRHAFWAMVQKHQIDASVFKLDPNLYVIETFVPRAKRIA